jgi:hypothetical protein
MHQGQPIFSQVIDFLPKKKFRQYVNRYSGKYRVRSFTCYDQLLCMAFAQQIYRDIFETILFVCNLYSVVSRNQFLGYQIR